MNSVAHAEIGPIAIHYPEQIETNAQLKDQFPGWDMDVIQEKTGIHQRYIAAEGETASDLAYQAAHKLLDTHGIDPGSIDYLLLCTQTPDYPLPTTACLLQQRLGLPTSAGALDFNLGCSGFVYGLGIAEGLIQTEQASRILLLTAETYSKYIDPADRSLRTIFSDAAAATLIETSPERSLSAFCYGTDGSGADTLLVRDGGARPLADAHQPRHRVRWKSRLYMDGPSLLGFTIVAVPNLIEQILAKTRPALSSDDIHLYLMHQATAKMLEQLQQRLGLSDHQLPIRLRECGNTVSCTLPILIDQMRSEGRLTPDQQTMLIGFGVGWSWGGCLWRDTHTASK